MKVLIIRFSSIGDIVLATPVLRTVSQQARAEVHFLTKKSFGSVVKGNPYIHKLWLLENDLTSIINDLKKESFDHVIDLHNNLRSWRVRRALKCPTSHLKKLNFKKWLLVNFKVDRMPKLSIVDRYLEATSPLKVKSDGEGLDFYIDQADLDASRQFTTGFGKAPFITLVLGAAHATKQIPDNKLKSFLEKVHIPVVLIGGPAEQELGDQLTSEKIVSAAGRCTIGVSAALMDRSAMVVTPDTGMMHIAAALKKPMISVWGNTVPEFGMYAYYGGEDVMDHLSEVVGLSCRPCSKIGYEKCPKGHFRCMEDQNEEEWVSIVRQQIRDLTN